MAWNRVAKELIFNTLDFSYSALSYRTIIMYLMYDCDTIYVLDGARLYGIARYKDISDYLLGRKTSAINRNFIYLHSEDDLEASAECISQMHPSISEIPILDKKNKTFEGVLFNKCAKKKNRRVNKNWIIDRLYGSLEAFQGGREDAHINWLLDEYEKWFAANEFDRFICVATPADEAQPNEIVDIVNATRKRLVSQKNPVSLKSVLVNFDEYQKERFFSDKDECDGKRLWENINQVSLNISEGLYKIDDLRSEFYTIEKNVRKTLFGEPCKRKLYCVGACDAFGAYCKDSETIESYLQKKLNDSSTKYEVINAGMFIQAEALNGYVVPLQRVHPGTEDVVLLICPKSHAKQISNRFSFVELWDVESEIESLGYDVLRGHFLESAGHYSYFVNGKIADVIAAKMTDPHTTDSKHGKRRRGAVRRTMPYFIEWNIVKYYKVWAKIWKVNGLFSRTGCIVMNCNPMTLGHYQLIEHASQQVDFLYVFVVQEDKSEFRFADRFAMIKEATKEFENVKVIPSGAYCISMNTFCQYFEKDNVKITESPEYDVRIFAEVIAKEFDISVRFVGDEPFDTVTNKYNMIMKEILPQYGIELVELPRYKLQNGKPISASEVRRLLKEGKKKQIEELVPRTTVRYISKPFFE